MPGKTGYRMSPALLARMMSKVSLGGKKKGAKARSGVKVKSITNILRRKTSKTKNYRGGASLSSFTHSNPIKKFDKNFRARLSTNYYNTNTSIRLVSGTNQQAGTDFGVLTGGTYAGTNFNSDLAYIQSKITGTSTGYKTTKICLESVVAKYQMVNQGLESCYVHIYDMVARRDTSYSPANALLTGLGDEGSASITTYGVTPYASRLLTCNYKILNHKRVALTIGQTHEHSVNYKVNKWFQSEVLQSAAQAIAGVTVYTLIIVSGCPTNDSVTSTNVGIITAVVDIVATKQMKYSWTQDNDTNYFYTNNLPSLTLADVVDIGSGTIIANPGYA